MALESIEEKTSTSEKTGARPEEFLNNSISVRLRTDHQCDMGFIEKVCGQGRRR